MKTECEHCGAPLELRIGTSADDEKPQFVELYGCGALIRWGHNARTLKRCAKATKVGQTDRPEKVA